MVSAIYIFYLKSYLLVISQNMFKNKNKIEKNFTLFSFCFYRVVIEKHDFNILTLTLLNYFFDMNTKIAISLLYFKDKL